VLGVSLYVLFCHILYQDLITFVKRCHSISVRRMFFNKGTIAFYIIYTLALFNFQYGELIHPAPKEWKMYLEQNCKNLGEIDKDAETENFFRFNLAFTISGAYFGVILEQKWMGTRKYVDFYKTSNFVTLKRIIVTLTLASPCLACIFLFPKKGYHWFSVMMFRTVIPVTLGNFYLFGFSKWISLKVGLINTTVRTDLDSTTSTDELPDKSVSEQKLKKN